VKDINYRSLRSSVVYKPQDPWITVGVSVAATAILVVATLLYVKYPVVGENAIIVAGLLLFLAFVVLLYYMIYDVQIKRNKLLRAFARDNNLTFKSTSPALGNDYIPRFVSSSSLLSGIRTLHYVVTPRSNMSLRGSYRGIVFNITIVVMYCVRRGNKAGVSFFQTIVIRSDALREFPHIIALSKLAERAFSALNTDTLQASPWQPALVGWEANAMYDIYSDTMRSDRLKDQMLSSMLARIHSVDESDVEITDSDIHVIKIDGIDFTEEGFRPIFEKIAIIAEKLA
jgi:hypothetical protein